MLEDAYLCHFLYCLISSYEFLPYNRVSIPATQCAKKKTTKQNKHKFTTLGHYKVVPLIYNLKNSGFDSPITYLECNWGMTA